MLTKLVVLNMRDCKRFRKFPSKVEMDSLEVLHLSGCSKVDKLPEFSCINQTLREFYIDGTAITELPSFVYSQRNLQVLEFGRREKKRSGWWTSISQPSWFPSKRQRTQSLIMPSLADLCFLRELKLSYCNISEVSDGIGGLSCLQSLCLNGNNFTSLPQCLSQLSHLEVLELSNCKKLQVLPQLPPNLSKLCAFDCTSLYQLPPNNNYNIRSFLTMSLDGCTKLFRNVSIESQACLSQRQRDLNSSITSQSCRNQISSFLQFMEFPRNTREIFGGQERKFFHRRMDIVYHGNIFPQWFTNTSTGNHIQVELPPDFCHNKVRGHAICVVLTPKNSSGRKSYHGTLRYSVKNFDGTYLLLTHGLFYDSIGIPKQDVMSFCFKKRLNWELVEAKSFVSFSFEENDDVEVKECGVRLVFDEDIQGEETGLSITQDLPTPTQDGGFITISDYTRLTSWSW